MNISSCSSQNNDMEKIRVLENLDSNIGIYFSNFLVLDDGYNHLISLNSHLYRSEDKWAIVFEKSSYNNSNLNVQIELIYFGNCLQNLDTVNDELYNKKFFFICEEEEIKKMYKDDSFENFELISKDSGVDSISIAGRNVNVEYDNTKYPIYDIVIRKDDNPDGLIDVVSLFRFIKEIDHTVFNATNEQLRTCIPEDLELLLTIDAWNHQDFIIPSELQSYQIMAKVIENDNPSLWNVENPNTDWRNWVDFGDY